MLRKSMLLLISIISFSLWTVVHSDLPVHCLKSQVVGTWKISTAPRFIPRSGQFPSCGHMQPDDPYTSWKAGVGEFVVSKIIEIALFSNNSAVKVEDGSPTWGNWTMMYDQGLSILFENERFTNFFFYVPTRDETPKSYCGRTTIGWYSNENGEKACWKGEKILAIGEREEDLISEATEQRFIVQPEDQKLRAGSSVQTQTIAKSSNSKQNLRKSNLDSNTEDQPDKQQIAINLRFDRNSKNHKEIVDILNKREKTKWTAKVYPEYESKTIGELNKMAGRKAVLKEKRNPMSLLQQEAKEDVSDLPREWSWEDKLGKVREQSGCGSCYVMATVQMLEARLRIKYNENVTLSAQDTLDCNYYNQGCEGGLPYLTELFHLEHPLVPEDCAPYQSRHTKCGLCDISKLEKVYKVTQFR